MGRKRNQYTKEYKIEAVRLIVDEGRPISEVARELGIAQSLLHRWKKKYEEGEIEPFPGQGRLPKEQGISISHESIYLHIYQDKYQGGNLHKHLRCQKKRRKRYGKQDRRGRISNRISIDERPAIVNNKSRIGDWEGDTIIGKGHRGVVAALVERKTQYTVLAKSKTKQAASVRQRIEQALTPHRSRVHTITYNNGLEFAEHQKIAQTLATNIYFAHPYASWERGLNENTNGLIRQHLPKSQQLEKVSQKELEYIMDQLNHRSRKSLGFKTPYELFFKKKTLLTVALTT